MLDTIKAAITTTLALSIAETALDIFCRALKCFKLIFVDIVASLLVSANHRALDTGGKCQPCHSLHLSMNGSSVAADWRFARVRSPDLKLVINAYNRPRRNGRVDTWHR